MEVAQEGFPGMMADATADFDLIWVFGGFPLSLRFGQFVFAARADDDFHSFLRREARTFLAWSAPLENRKVAMMRAAWRSSVVQISPSPRRVNNFCFGPFQNIQPEGESRTSA